MRWLIRRWWQRYVERVPGVSGGQPVVRGTRIRVTDIAQWLRWYNVDYILRNFPDLTSDDIYAARDCFAEHKDELDAYIRQDKETEQQLLASFGAELEG